MMASQKLTNCCVAAIAFGAFCLAIHSFCFLAKASRMRWFSLLIVLLCASGVHAAPDFGQFRDIAGVRVYRDHQRTDTWYLTPPPPQLALRDDGEPDFGFDLYRYLGSQATGDRNAFWVRGILSVRISRDWEPAVTARIRQELTTAGIKRPKLRSMPIAEAQIRLLFGDLDASWRQGSRWSGGQLMLPLNAELAELLWQAAERGQTLISLAVDEQLAGVRRTEEEWRDERVPATCTLPVTLDMNALPGHFRRTSLGGRMVRGYTGIDVFCFDFLENLDPQLYAKAVEVAIPTNGRDLVEELVFREDGIYRGRIDFELSRDLDQPYRYRICRILRNGSRETGPWQEKRGDSLLDVTRYREVEGDAEAVEP
jgi:hypothetical protein